MVTRWSVLCLTRDSFGAREKIGDPAESYPEIDAFLENVSRTYIRNDETVVCKFSIAEAFN
jgi:hypothetical protein